MGFRFRQTFSDGRPLVVSICGDDTSFIAGFWSSFKKPYQIPGIRLDFSTMLSSQKTDWFNSSITPTKTQTVLQSLHLLSDTN
jgi:hypothetical protein